MQRRIEERAAGRAALSVLICVLVVTIAIGGLPDGSVRRDLVGRAAPVLNAAGLDQRWDLFAPDPRRVSIDLAARISLSDGTQATWRPPRRDALTGAYSDYRWRKLTERTIVRGGDPTLARWIAGWVARRYSRNGRAVLQVQLVARLANLAAAGRDARHDPAFIERTLVTLRPGGEPAAARP